MQDRASVSLRSAPRRELSGLRAARCTEGPGFRCLRPLCGPQRGLECQFQPPILASAEHPDGLAREGAGRVQAEARSRAPLAKPAQGHDGPRLCAGALPWVRGDSEARYPAGMTLATHVAPGSRRAAASLIRTGLRERRNRVHDPPSLARMPFPSNRASLTVSIATGARVARP